MAVDKETLEAAIQNVEAARREGNEIEVARLEQEIARLKGGKSKHIHGTAEITLPKFHLELSIVEEDFETWNHDGNGTNAGVYEEMMIPVKDLHYKGEKYMGSEWPQPLSPEILDSVCKHGIINPLIVAQNNKGDLFVYIGNQRLAAARLRGIERVPCVFANSNDDVKKILNRYKKVD